VSADQFACQSCEEYRELSRRGFMRLGAAATASAAVLSTAPAWLPRVAFARDPGPSGPRDVIISIYLRGGADGLSVCVPFDDPVYAGASTRPTLRVYAPDDTSQPVGKRALHLDNASLVGGSSTYTFGFHPAMAGLIPAYVDGKLAVIHGAGLTSTNKSHFDAQRWMETGQPANGLITGWLGRHLGLSLPVNPTTALRAIGVADGLQRTLAGSPLSLPVPNLQTNPGTPPLLNNLAAVSATNTSGYGLTGTSATNVARRGVLGQMHAASPDPLATAAVNTLNTIDRLNQIGAAGYAPSNGAVYPGNAFGYAMRSAAALINANGNASVNQTVEAIAIDTGSWDTHSAAFTYNAGTGAFTGSMVTRMSELADGLGAFYRDVIAGRGQRVTIVCVSEFGRRVGENGTTGTDHGYGNVMMVLGSHVLGGRVLGSWNGLPGGQATNQDVPVTTDIRHILAEAIDRRLNNAQNLGAIFPGFTPVYRGVFA
jgi:uncharacterized protein (DUF1501 family)